MSYRRKHTRPMRVVERREAEAEIEALREQCVRLTGQIDVLHERLSTSESLREILMRDLGKLVVELRHERTKVDFLTGRHGFQCEPWDIRRIFG